MLAAGSGTVLLEGPPAAMRRWAAALRLLDMRPAGEGDQPQVALVHADSGGRGHGPQRVAALRASGVRTCVGVVPPRRTAMRAAFTAAGAIDVISTETPREDIAGRIRCVLRNDELEHRVALFQAVVDALPVSLHAIDRAFRIVVWNRGREAGPLGRPRGEVLGRDLFQALSADRRLRAHYDQVFERAVPRADEVHSAATRPARLFRVEKVPMRLPGETAVSHVVTFARDVTAERSVERLMAQAEKLGAIARLAAGVAHEINNPLFTIAGCAESIEARLAGPLDDAARREVRDDAALIGQEAFRCKEILGGLLDFSRAGRERRGPCDAGEIAARAVRLLRHNPRVDGVTFESNVDPATPPLWGDADQLVQVVLALGLNAADAAKAGGRVRLSVGPRGADSVVLAVEDDGPGVPAELREQIFEPFFTTKPPGQGTGLGLSVAYGLVEAHGGRLALVEHEGAGARFEAVLPARVPAADETPASEVTP